jgi:hypothetical protein
MGEFSKEELVILDDSIEQIESQILTGIEENADKDRMLYASCLNDKEKEDLTKKEIKKQQKKLTKCPADISAYITAYINPSSFDIENKSIDQYRVSIIRNYITSTFAEVFEYFLKNKPKTVNDVNEENNPFLELLADPEYYGIDYDNIKAFVKFMIIADRLKDYKSILESIDAERAIEEYEKLVAEDDNEIYKLLDTLRKKDHTDLQLYDIVKECTQLNKDALQYLYKDIEVYLFGEKDEFECKYSEDETEQAIEDLKAKGHSEDDLIMLRYISKMKVFNIETNKMDLDFIYINKEKIFFPFEFFPIYSLQGLINAELSKIKEKEELLNPQILSTTKLKTDLSVPQLSLLFKMVNDLKPKVFNTKSDAELFRFISANFQTKKSSEKGISTQKLRNEFNNPDIKAIEFWEKHLHTMLSNIRKLK